MADNTRSYCQPRLKPNASHNDNASYDPLPAPVTNVPAFKVRGNSQQQQGTNQAQGVQYHFLSDPNSSKKKRTELKDRLPLIFFMLLTEDVGVGKMEQKIRAWTHLQRSILLWLWYMDQALFFPLRPAKKRCTILYSLHCVKKLYVIVKFLPKQKHQSCSKRQWCVEPRTRPHRPSKSNPAKFSVMEPERFRPLQSCHLQS